MLRIRLRSASSFSLIVGTALLLTGCPKSNPEFEAGTRAETIQDFDTALVHFERALRASPTNTEYRLRSIRARFEAGQFHIDQGAAAAKRGDLESALAEFERAQAIDPSSAAADQEIKRTLSLLGREEGGRGAQGGGPSSAR